MMEDVKSVRVIEQQGLHLSADLILPRNTVTHVNGILAQRGMGKTYTALALMEEMVEQGLFVGFFDPLGVAWGIRSSADGEHEGLPVLIFGGKHGDLPLDPGSGKLVAQAILELRQPFILDASQFMTVDQQRAFLADFIEAFRPYDQVLLHVIIDESDLFAPQMPKSIEANRSLEAVSTLVRRFRFKGLGATLITQRPAELNKGVMQFDILIALCIIQPHDVKALLTWIEKNATAEETAVFLATLSTLPIGTAWIWSPQWLHLFKQVKIRERHTFDSSQTPDVDVVPREPRKLAEINLASLSAQMTALMDRAKETDPAYLQRRIRELEQQIADARPVRANTHPRQTQDSQVADLRTQLAQAEQRLTGKEQEIQGLRQQIDALKAVNASVNGTSVSLVDVPAYLQEHKLHIDTATITIAHLNGSAAATKTPQAAHTPTTRAKDTTAPSAELPKRLADPPQKAPTTIGGISQQEQRTLNRILKKMEALTGNEQSLFTWLLTHDGQWIAASELAAAVCISERATKSDRTQHLKKIEFIHRDGARFRAAFADYARVAFASATDLQAIRQRLIDAAR